MAKRPDSTNDKATSGKPAELMVLPAPRINLNDLDGLRREMARVYRDMRGGRVHSQDGARLVYVLSELRKMFEACDLEKRIAALERGNDDHA